MKKIILLMIFCLPLVTFSQQTEKSTFEKFNILSYGEVKDISFYVQSINACNLDNWRLQSKRSVLLFEAGFKIELLSAEELKKTGLNIDVTSFKKDFPADYEMPLFKVFPNGKLGAGVTHSDKHFNAKK